jgi:hypothetical protein
MIAWPWRLNEAETAAINIASRSLTGNRHNGRDEQMFGAK